MVTGRESAAVDHVAGVDNVAGTVRSFPADHLGSRPALGTLMMTPPDP
jgi:hypothetical protein